MTMILEQAARPGHVTIAGGEASLADIAGAARRGLLYVDNANAAHEALDRAIEERIGAVHSATGQQLENPLRRAEDEWRRRQISRQGLPNPFTSFGDTGSELQTLQDLRESYLDEFEAELFVLDGRFAESIPARQAIGAGRPLMDDATRIARQSDEELARFMSSRGGVAKWGAMLAGGIVGSLNDPVTIASLALGGGPGAARTVAGRILSVAGKEALINAGTEAVIQPGVQAWRKKAGLDHGLDQALANILFAGVLGGTLGGAIGAAGEGIRRLAGRRELRRATQTLRAEQTRLSEPARAILADDGIRAADSLAEIREALPAEARGALDAAETIRLADESRPASATPGFHDRTNALADAAIRAPDMEAWPGFEPDPAQIERVTQAIAGPSTPRTRQAVENGSLIDFLVDRGGVQEFRGELQAAGAVDVVRPFRGRLVKDTGLPLDRAREAAAEAGFFDHLYGTPAEATARSTVADLLDGIEMEARAGGGPRPPAAEEAAFAGLESTVAAIARHAGPAVDDAILERAARLSLDEGLDPFDAIEQVLVQEELAAPSRGTVARSEPLPGWSDEELLAASGQRGAPPEPDGLDEPGRLDPADIEMREFAELADDALVPTENGLVSASELMAGIERRENLLRVTAACRM